MSDLERDKIVRKCVLAEMGIVTGLHININEFLKKVYIQTLRRLFPNSSGERIKEVICHLTKQNMMQ